MAVKPIYGVGLDAGSSRTRLAICVLEEGGLRFLGYGYAESHGWRKGNIADQSAVSESILAALREAEAAAGVSVEGAVIGMGGSTVRGGNARGVVELGYVREIEQSHVNRAVDRASRVQLPEDRMVLQRFPQDFVVDEHPGHSDPRNMLASRLEVNVHLLTAAVQEHSSLIGAVNQAHLAVEESIFEAFAASYAVALPENRRDGIAVIVIGAESTEIVVYDGDAMQLATSVRICGDHFTRDLAQALCVGFEDAELVKLEYGGAASERCAGNILVELPTPEDREYRAAPRKFINQVLEARAAELFQLMRTELTRVSMEGALLGGVFLAGAGARLPDLCDVAERILQCPARYGIALGIRDWPDSLKDPEWSVVAGLAMYSAKLKAQASRQRRESGWLGKVLR